MTDVNQLITEHLDIWTSAIEKKSSAGRGNGGSTNLHGIKRLRSLILELAVRGKLVPQDASDGSANSYLDDVLRVRAELVKHGKAKKLKKLSAIPESVTPFEIPKGWAWARLQDISGYIQRGKSPKYAGQGSVQVVSQKCVQWGGFDLEKARFINDESLEGYSPERFLRNGDILWNSTGTGTVGRVLSIEVDEDQRLVADSHVTVVRSISGCPKFLEVYLSSSGIQDRIEPTHESSLVSGSTKQVELNTSTVNAIPIPLPPLAEQHRIVAKVDELMALCDALERQAEDSLKAHQTLVETCLTTLTNSPSPEELTQNWTRIEAHFDTLFTTEESIDRLMETVISLAVQGRLTRQFGDEEPFSVHWREINASKAALARRPGFRKKKPLPDVDPNAAPFEVPDAWEWVKLDDVVDISGGITKGRKLAGRTTVQFPYLRVANVQRGYLDLDEIKEIALPVEEVEKYQLLDGDLLITEGGDWDKVGRTAIWRGETDVMGHQNHVFRARKLIAKQHEEWFELYLNCSFARDYFAGSSKQTTNLASINMTQLRACMVPMPPFEEQSRILSRVSSFRALASRLRECLAHSARLQTDFANNLTSKIH